MVGTEILRVARVPRHENGNRLSFLIIITHTLRPRAEMAPCENGRALSRRPHPQHSFRRGPPPRQQQEMARHLCCDLLPFRAQLRRGGKAVHLRSFATAEEQEAALCAIARAAYNLLSVCR